MTVTIERKLFTARECERMGETGILREDERVELVNGEIISMTPIGLRHVACVNRLTALFTELLGRRVIVSVQNPVQLAAMSEPQPDIVLFKPQADYYASTRPSSMDVLLVVEVAETSIYFDRDVKIPLYAEAMIPEVWLVELEAETLTQYTRPANGKYQTAQVQPRREWLAATTAQDLEVSVDQILG